MTEDMTGFLLDQFEILADAPGGVKQLRELILQLAVTGRLGTGDETDEPEKIPEFCPVTLNRNKSATPSKVDTIVDNLVNGISLPSNWRITVLNSLGDWSTGGTPSRTQLEYFNGDIPWIKSGDLNDGLILKTDEHITKKGLNNSNAKILPKGTVSVALYGATIGRIGILGVEASTNQACANCIPDPNKINTRYLYYFIIQQRKNLIESGQGGAQPNITNGILRNWPIFLPPLAEQRRIVEKVDSLMALCDDLEAKQTQKHSHLVKLGTGSLNALQQSTTEEELIRWWGHLQTNFGLIFDCVENVEALRQTILELAVTGRLGTGDERDEPAEEFVKRIREKKQLLIKEGIIKNEKSFEPIIFDEKLVNIPDNWSYQYLNDICELIADPDHKMPISVKDGVKFISSKDLSDSGIINFDKNIKLISEEDYSRLARKINPKRGDILFARIGAKIGKPCIVDSDERFMISYSCCVIRPLLVNIQYLQIFLKGSTLISAAYEKTQGIGVPDLGMKMIKQFIVPLPPLEEQLRIVEKVKSLNSLCDKLEQKIKQRTNQVVSLSNATIQKITG